VNAKNQFIAQVCHIEAAEQRGERFNPKQSDEDRRGYGNLLILCYPHHVETNDVSLFPKERLLKIKSEHERAFEQKHFQIDDRLLHKISYEMADYWREIDRLHAVHHAESDLAMEIDAQATFVQVADQAASIVKDLSFIRSHLIEADQLRKAEDGAALARARAAAGPNDFEILYIGFTNVITKLSLTLVQMEIKYLEEYLKLTPSDLDARKRLDKRKEEFQKHALRAGYVD
jgi:hypothetical protein